GIQVGLTHFFLFNGEFFRAACGSARVATPQAARMTGGTQIMMKGSEFLRYVDQLNHDKNIPREIVFEAVEAAVRLAMEKFYGDEQLDIVVTIDRDNGEMTAKKGEEAVDPAILGRIAAQSAKQAIIQKIREAEST